MNLQTILKAGVSLVSLVMTSLVLIDTGNPILALVAALSASMVYQYLTGISFGDGSLKNSLFFSPLLGLRRKYQAPSLGGSKRLYLVPVDYLTAEFLDYELARTSGKFSGSIPLEAGKKFTEIEAWYDTLKWDSEMKTGAGFTQGMEFEVLGYDDEIVKLQALLYELPVNAIVQGNDNKLYYLGQKYVPLMFDCTATSPLKGTDRKKASFKTKNDGFTCPVMPLAATVTFAVEPLPAAV